MNKNNPLVITGEQKNSAVASDPILNRGRDSNNFNEYIDIPVKGERRRAFIVFFLLVIFIYFPRLPRLENYLLVTTKHNFFLLPPGSAWRGYLENKIKNITFINNWPFNLAEVADKRVTSIINNALDSINCPPKTINSFVNNDLQIGSSGLKYFSFLCRGPISKAISADNAKRSITSDGHIFLNKTKSVFLAGDSLMQGPALLIAQELKIKGISVINASRISTGLSYPQFFDWDAAIKNAINTKKISAVVIFLGANDTFDIYHGNSLVKLGSPAWRKLYGSRIAGISQYAKEHNVALLWLGLPAMNRSDIQPYIHTMNTLYRTEALRYNGLFMRTDNLIGKQEDRYTAKIIINGSPVVTRSDDGVHFTPYGWKIISNAVINYFDFK